MRWPCIIAFCIVFLAIGVTGSAGAATLDFTGTLRILIGKMRYFEGELAYLTVPGAGAAQVTDDSDLHLLSFTLADGSLGPSTVTIPGTPLTGTGVATLRFTLSRNLAGSFSGISGGAPGGGAMGLQGIAKICLFAPGCVSSIPLPLTPTTGGAGFGIGGTRTATGNVNITFQDAPWTLGQPVMTRHTPGSTISTPMLPGGFAHGPASLTSSTAQPSGVLQLVTVTKVYTSLVGAFPEVPLTGVLTVNFVPEPGTLLLLLSGGVPFALLAWWRHDR